jgi:hypothetical protein
VFTLTIADFNWSIEFETETKPPMINSAINTFIQQIVALHGQSALIKISFNNNIFKIEFVDGRTWKIKILTFDSDSNVIYLLNNTDQWLRSFILGFLTPVTSSLMSIHSTYHISKFAMTHL